MLSLFCGAYVAFASACGTPMGPQEAVITLDPSRGYQTVVGWEATAQAGQSFRSFTEYRDKLVSDSIDDLGINRLRVELRSGLENRLAYPLEDRSKRYEIINDNDDPFLIDEAGFKFDELDHVIEQLVLPMRSVLAKRNESLLINLNYVDFGVSEFEHKDNPEEYAEFILAAFLHMKAKFGFVPDTVEVVLEPDTDNANWNARQIANAVVATSRRLAAHGFAVGFVAPSTTDASNALTYIDEIASVPEALDKIVEFSYHRYSGVSDDVLRSIADRASLHSKRTSMLEWIGADHEALQKDLKLANVSAWQQYTLAFSGKDDGGAYYKVDSEESGGIRMGRRTKFLRQYFRCVRPGSVRIDASSSNENFDPVAFEEDGVTTSVVIKTDHAGTIAVRGLSPGRYSVSYTTDDLQSDARADELVVEAGMDLTSSIPSDGVLTVCREQ